MNALKYILTVDLGGTHCRYQLMQRLADNQWQVLTKDKYRNKDHASFIGSVACFLSGHCSPDFANMALVVGLAGVVDGEIGRVTNHPWVISKSELKQHFGFNSILLRNDLEMQAWGVQDAKACNILHPGEIDFHQPSLTVGVGTGLGMAYAIHSETNQLRVFATETGLSELIVFNQTHIPLWQYIYDHYGHVCTEYLLSGSGLKNIYQYLNKSNTDLTSADILQSAKQASDEVALKSVTLFCEILAGFLGSLALLFRPGGGIHLVGGMVERTQFWLKNDQFQSSYCHNAKMADIISQYPVMLYTQDDLALIGGHRAMLDQL